MNTKRFIITCLVVWIAMIILDWVIHGLILAGSYRETAQLWRPESEMISKMWIMYLGQLLFAIFFVFVFTKGYENRGLLEGLRYGIYVFFIALFPGALAQYSTMPLAFSMTLSWIVLGFIEFLILGLLAAVLYKPATV